jgi:hypothetical protein
MAAVRDPGPRNPAPATPTFRKPPARKLAPAYRAPPPAKLPPRDPPPRKPPPPPPCLAEASSGAMAAPAIAIQLKTVKSFLRMRSSTEWKIAQELYPIQNRRDTSVSLARRSGPGHFRTHALRRLPLYSITSPCMEAPPFAVSFLIGSESGLVGAESGSPQGRAWQVGPVPVVTMSPRSGSGAQPSTYGWRGRPGLPQIRWGMQAEGSRRRQ